MINSAAVNEVEINSSGEQPIIVLPLPIFLSTSPTVEPVIMTFSGANGIVPTGAAANNLYQAGSSYQSVVIDINTPETPISGNY